MARTLAGIALEAGLIRWDWSEGGSTIPAMDQSHSKSPEASPTGDGLPGRPGARPLTLVDGFSFSAEWQSKMAPGFGRIV